MEEHVKQVGRVYEFRPFRLDVAAHRLTQDGRDISLTIKPFRILAMLVRERDRVVEKEEILRDVWHDVNVSDDSLTQNVSVIRKALGDNSAEPAYIATIARRGYRFIAPVTEISTADSAPAGAPADVEARAVAVHPPSLTPVDAAAGRRRRFGWVAVAVAVVALSALAAVLVRRPAPAVRPVRLFQVSPAGTTLTAAGVLSPDGRYLAFSARESASAKTRLWVRDLEAAEPRLLPATDGASRPFWSPDGQSLGFFADGTLKTVGLTGEPPRTIATVGVVDAGGTWATSGTILFADLWGLSAVSASGGEVTSVTTIDQAKRDGVHRYPQFLPDGRHFLFYLLSADRDRAGTYVGSLDSRDQIRVLDGASMGAIYVSTGHLLYVRDRSLMARRFDASTLRLSGEPFMLAGNVPGPSSAGASISASGNLLAFGGGTTRERLTWFDRSGKKLGEIDTPAAVHSPMLAADQMHLVGVGGDPEHAGVWLIDLQRDATSRIVPNGSWPIVSPDGARVAFTSNRNTGVLNLYMRTSGRNEDEPLLSNAEHKTPSDWSRDGRYIVFVSSSPKTKQDLWILPTFGDRKPIPFLQMPSNEIQAQVSPDGRQIAYASDESGSWEVYGQSFPTAGAKRIISIAGGAEPQWRGDGRELFYLAADDTMMAVDVKSSEPWEVGRPKPLFRASIRGSVDRTYSRGHYAVTADGQRFVIDTVDPDRVDPISIVVNWAEWLRR